MRDWRQQRLACRVGDHRRMVALSLVLLISAEPAFGQSKVAFDAARKTMVNEAVLAAGVDDRRVIQAMLATPRHEFVPTSLRNQAYYDMALPIGSQQTISSPFIVAFMTQALDPRPDDRVLEIGTGSGYQAAVLSPLVKDVYSIEIVESLGRRAERTLRRLQYENVHTKVGDGYQGWPEHAPFDKIIVTCSPEKVPVQLVEQLSEGGLMVIPTGERYQQTLYLMRKKDNKLVAEALRPTLFVPMTGIAEENRQVLPDPAKPQAINGGFEAELGENEFVPGWYYQRQLAWVHDPVAPEGEHFVTFTNETEGRAAHLLQGIPIDGRHVGEVELSAQVRYEGLWYPLRSESFPMLAMTLYDENRKDLGIYWIGPFRGDSDWKQVRKRVRIPVQAREGLLRIGLFGATGTISFDDVRITPIPR